MECRLPSSLGPLRRRDRDATTFFHSGPLAVLATHSCKKMGQKAERSLRSRSANRASGADVHDGATVIVFPRSIARSSSSAMADPRETCTSPPRETVAVKRYSPSAWTSTVSPS